MLSTAQRALCLCISLVIFYIFCIFYSVVHLLTMTFWHEAWSLDRIAVRSFAYRTRTLCTYIHSTHISIVYIRVSCMLCKCDASTGRGGQRGHCQCICVCLCVCLYKIHVRHIAMRMASLIYSRVKCVYNFLGCAVWKLAGEKRHRTHPLRLNFMYMRMQYSTVIRLPRIAFRNGFMCMCDAHSHLYG